VRLLDRVSVRLQNVALVVVACIVTPTVTAHLMPHLLSDSTALLLATGLAVGIAALSLNLLLGYAGQLSLGHGALLGVGAFAGSVVVDRWSAPMFLGWIFAALMGGCVALVIGVPALRLRGLYLAIITIVFGLTLQASVLRWQFFTHGSAGASLPRRLFGDTFVRSPVTYLTLVLLVVVGVWLVDQNVTRTKLGRAFRMLKEDEDVAQAHGINVTFYKLLAFVISGAIAGLAGALYGHAVGLVNSDSFPLQLSLRLVLIVIIGGIGHRWGAVTVAVLLTLSPKLPSFLRDYDLVIAAAIVLYNVVRLPGGLAGAVHELRTKARGARAAAPADSDEALVIPTFGTDDRGTPLDAGDTGPVLRTEGLSIRFGGLIALDEVSLEVPRGQIVGIIGPNGAGKSTLFNVISGLLAGAQGGVFLEDRPIHGLAPHRRAELGLGRTFQLVGLGREMTVRENLLMAQHRAARYSPVAALVGSRRAQQVEHELAERADALLDALGFRRFADLAVRNLSGGQQRLVELACVLATQPKLLMLDEPTAGLSPAAAENLAERLHALRREQGQSILLIEHNVPLVLDLCDYIYVLNFGRLLAEGTPDALSSRPEILGAYLGDTVPAR
jgi:ABC-type branched-subunit amino acid transport system ATPase component/ABC-type branched-subunit amino acid transport system permease subunit